MLFFPSLPRNEAAPPGWQEAQRTERKQNAEKLAPDPQPRFLNSNLSQGKQDVNTLSLGNRNELAPAVEEAGAPLKGSSGDNRHRIFQEEGITDGPLTPGGWMGATWAHLPGYNFPGFGNEESLNFLFL